MVDRQSKIATSVVTAQARHLEHKQFFKTKLCKFNKKHRCSRGDECVYAHSQEELRPLPDFHRTRLCDDFTLYGDCAKGDLCSFAHQTTELRQRSSKQQASSAPLSGLAYRAMSSTAEACESVGKQTGVVMLPCSASPMRSQCALPLKVDSYPEQNYQVTKLSSQKQLTSNGSNLLQPILAQALRNSFGKCDDDKDTLNCEPQTLRQGMEGGHQEEEEEADNDWKELGFVIVQNTFLEWKPQNWAESSSAVWRSQSADGCLEHEDFTWSDAAAWRLAQTKS